MDCLPICARLQSLARPISITHGSHRDPNYNKLDSIVQDQSRKIVLNSPPFRRNHSRQSIGLLLGCEGARQQWQDNDLDNVSPTENKHSLFSRTRITPLYLNLFPNVALNIFSLPHFRLFTTRLRVDKVKHGYELGLSESKWDKDTLHISLNQTLKVSIMTYKRIMACKIQTYLEINYKKE